MESTVGTPEILATILSLLKAIYKFFTHPDVTGLASVAGAVLSGYVLWSVKDLKKRMLFAARMPQILAMLEENASNISKALNSYDEDPVQVDIDLNVCEAHLMTIKSKVSGEARKSVDACIHKISGYKKGIPPRSKQQVWSIYTDVCGLVQSLKNLTDDYRIEQA